MSITAIRKRLSFRKRLKAAIQREARRINPYWRFYLPRANEAEAGRIIRNVRRLEKLAEKAD